MKKTVKILNHNKGGRLANQLWLYINIYAYCLEKHYQLKNYCFFQYSKYFNIPKKSKIINIIFFSFPKFLKIIFPKKYLETISYYQERIYELFTDKIKKYTKFKIIYAPDSDTPVIHYLKPTKNTDSLLDEFEKNKDRIIFFEGWVFRNPIGINKFHKEIMKYFRPKFKIQNKINTTINNLKSKYKHVVGVHIRQGDYKKRYKNGKLYFNEKEINSILKEYLKNFKKNVNKICFIVCSDEDVNLNYFKNLNVIKNNGNPIEDLFLLANTDIIIGADSTFGALASYFGNIPFIIFQRDKIDWTYYLDKNKYFENKYCTSIQH